MFGELRFSIIRCKRCCAPTPNYRINLLTLSHLFSILKLLIHGNLISSYDYARYATFNSSRPIVATCYREVFDSEVFSTTVQMSSAPNGLMLFIATSCLIIGSQAFRLNLVNPSTKPTNNNVQKLTVTKGESGISQQHSERKIIYIRFPLPHFRDEVIQKLKNDIVLSKAIEGTFLSLNRMSLYSHSYDSSCKIHSWIIQIYY